jgi:hypothetical protein
MTDAGGKGHENVTNKPTDFDDVQSLQHRYYTPGFRSALQQALTISKLSATALKKLARITRSSQNFLKLCEKAKKIQQISGVRIKDNRYSR